MSAMKRQKRQDSFMLVDTVRLVEARGDRKAAHVAEDVGVSRQRMCDWESGRKRMPLSILKKVADLYGKPVDHFLNKNFAEICFNG